MHQDHLKWLDLKSKIFFFIRNQLELCIFFFQFRLDNIQQRRPPMTAPQPPRPSSALGFRPPRTATQTNLLSSTNATSNSSINTTAESTLLDENGLPLVGNLLAFTPDVIQVFQEAAKLIEESKEIKKQAINQIKDAFNDAKAYSLTVNQSVAQKLADIITLAVRQKNPFFSSLETFFSFHISN